ncbi:GyrI-like domain-containing protein [Geothrix sp. PMB-07]|uniref:GyrI-like domain-containing protein n=1 Tax=Geothrix sp. PMB-07 TaxID=3068640 RepID=UPI002740AB6C|nr:effector binding domain-containing protein [Geothrix sp. PMB-07]WLT33456.1 effector binding domain-containing protein [Geothrix sp. PMB-07]
MEPRSVLLEPFTVSGHSLRTNNAEEADLAAARIPGLWERFMAEDLAGKLGGASPAIHGVYSAYESDHRGSYQITVGVTVPHAQPAFDSVTVAAGRYLVFEGRGPLPQAVMDTWARVWSYFENPEAPRRQFQTDFESYGPDDTVFIHISIH